MTLLGLRIFTIKQLFRLWADADVYFSFKLLTIFQYSTCVIRALTTLQIPVTQSHKCINVKIFRHFKGRKVEFAVIQSKQQRKSYLLYLDVAKALFLRKQFPEEKMSFDQLVKTFFTVALTTSLPILGRFSKTVWGANVSCSLGTPDLIVVFRNILFAYSKLQLCGSSKVL